MTSAQSCASCHSPGFGWGDGLAVGVGHGMAKLGRHSPTIVNAAWGAIFMWDGRLGDLEEQALGPIQAAGEMNMPLEQLMERLNSIGEYKPLFVAAFPHEGMSTKTLAKAIATYERTVVSERAPLIHGSREMRRRFPRKPSAALPFQRQGALFRPAMRAGTSPMTAFRTSGCRARTSAAENSCRAWSRCSTPSRRLACAKLRAEVPFMHDGSLATLEAVVEHYDRGGVDRPSRSDLMKPLGLTAQEKSDLVAFMKTLTSNLSPTAVPVLPR